MIQLISILFFFLIFSLTIVEKKRTDSVITPFTVAAWPLAIISLFVNIILIHFDFDPVSLRVHIYLIFHLLLLWVVGWLFSYFYENTNNTFSKETYGDFFKDFVRYENILMIISIIILVIYFRKFNSMLSANGGWFYFASSEFEDKISKGIEGHLLNIGRVFFIILGFIYPFAKRKILVLFTLIGLAIAFASTHSKYGLIIPLLIIFYWRILRNPPQIQIKKFMYFAVGIALLMNAFWIIFTIAWGTFSFDNDIAWNFFRKMSLSYFVSGPIMLEQWLNYPEIKPDWALLISFKHILNVLISDPQRFSTVSIYTIGFKEIAPGIISNVGTSYGVYHLIGGHGFTIFMNALLSLMSYYFFYESRKRKNFILFYLNLIFLAFGTLTFFVQFISIFSIHEITLFYVFFILLFKFWNYIQSLIKVN